MFRLILWIIILFILSIAPNLTYGASFTLVEEDLFFHDEKAYCELIRILSDEHVGELLLKEVGDVQEQCDCKML